MMALGVVVLLGVQQLRRRKGLNSRTLAAVPEDRPGLLAMLRQARYP